MKMDTLKQYVSLREGLEREKADLERRLQAINEALGAEELVSPAAAREPQEARRGPRRMSAAARARIAAAQRERWAKARGEQGAKPAAKPAAKSTGKKGASRKMSSEQRAKIAEAQRKRWAAYRARKGGA